MKMLFIKVCRGFGKPRREGVASKGWQQQGAITSPGLRGRGHSSCWSQAQGLGPGTVAFGEGKSHSQTTGWQGPLAPPFCLSPLHPRELGAGSPDEAVCRGQPPGHMGLQHQENTQHRILSAAHKVVSLGAASARKGNRPDLSFLFEYLKLPTDPACHRCLFQLLGCTLPGHRSSA